ncbi:hypothetical protein [Streptomyces sp. WY228]|uniref:hypothetical protein n=1 Tax=Streptomyces sp. WY228 TaxID=2855836 RepID=UPI001C4F05DA|nr:hypothetical protein [Streptomyces sp. WY228]QXQ99942.1 hypothetical protein KV381_28875 [Streptomyces sp. WY228]
MITVLFTGTAVVLLCFAAYWVQGQNCTLTGTWAIARHCWPRSLAPRAPLPMARGQSVVYVARLLSNTFTLTAATSVTARKTADDACRVSNASFAWLLSRVATFFVMKLTGRNPVFVWRVATMLIISPPAQRLLRQRGGLRSAVPSASTQGSFPTTPVSRHGCGARRRCPRYDASPRAQDGAISRSAEHYAPAGQTAAPVQCPGRGASQTEPPGHGPRRRETRSTSPPSAARYQCRDRSTETPDVAPIAAGTPPFLGPRDHTARRAPSDTTGGG